MAIAPNGTRYTFAHLVYRGMPYLQEPVTATGGAVGVHPMTAGSTNILARRDASMYVTQIEDRFGNTLTYNWNGDNLSSIVASDGRTLTLSYISGTSLIYTATLQSPNSSLARTWTYSYSGANTSMPSLSGVQLPDGSAWKYQIGNLELATLQTQNASCQSAPNLLSQAVTGNMTHPSGLTATFTITPILHGRSYVPQSCWGISGGGPSESYATIPNTYYQFSLTKEVLSGAGIPTETFTWNYSAPNQSWLSDSCASSNTCPSTVYTDVVDPDGHDVRYTFSNRYDATEGQLLRTDYYSGAAGTSLLRSEVNTYANPTGGPWPAEYGFDIQTRTNQAQVTEVSPLQQRQITQNSGDTYTWYAAAFNPYAQATDVKRYNSIAGQQPIEETTTYLNDTNLWVLGLPQTVTNVGTGEVESSNTYYSNDTLKSRARFGETLMNYTFNSAGQLASFTDGNNHTTTLGNYYRGIPQSISYPDNTSESLVVDDFGQISSLTDQAGYTTSYSYDSVGRITGITYPYNSNVDSAHWSPTAFSYVFVASNERGVDSSGTGHWRRTTTTGNASTVTYFDAMLRPLLSDTSIIGTANSDISTADAYDWQGETTFTSYPVAGAPALSAITAGTHSTYDALERLTQSQQDSELGTLTTTIAYLVGAGQQLTDPKGNVTTSYYQVFDQPSDSAVIQVLAPAGITQTIARDVYGNPLSITQSGLYGTENDSVTKTLTYDSYHRLCRSTEPESGSTVMSYDGANNVAWSAAGLAITGTGCGQAQATAAAQTARTYDAMNRVLTITPPTGTQSTTYTYDPLGHTASATSGNNVWWAVYNTRGQITGEALWVSGQSAWGVGYGYDAYDHLSAIGYPGSTSESILYAPDALGRPTQAGSYASGVQYFPDGNVQGYTLGNGITALVQQNVRQLQSNLSYALGGTPRLNEAYVYDKDANLTSITDLVNGQNTQTLGYDALNRLTSASAPNEWGTQTYAYDALNNLRQNVGNGWPYNMNIDANNRLTSLTIGNSLFVTYQNDARGNRSGLTYNGSTTSYTFDAKNQLLTVSGTASYAYDAAGRRVEKTLTGTGASTFSFYNHAGQLMYAYDATSGLGTNYIYLDGKLIARHQGSTITYLLTDRLGSSVRETNTSGTITATPIYEPYGALYSGPNQTQPGFTGHVRDPETAFVYMQARFYDPLGHMLSVDPIAPSPGNVYSFNRYAYANNNPVMHTDPDGRQSTDACSVVQCISVNMNGTIQRVPSAVGAQEFLAQGSGSSISDYTNTSLPSRVDTAKGLDKVSLGATAVAYATAADLPPVAAGAGVVDVSAAFGAFLLAPTWPRAGNVLTAGAFGMLKATAKGTEAAVRSVEQAEQANRGLTILKEAQPSSTDATSPSPPPPITQTSTSTAAGNN
ncbi:hypothetical protein GCM10027065_29160 [Rhodanobacter koreensis]